MENGGLEGVDAIRFPINILCVLSVKITLIQDCKDPLDLMEVELVEEELDVQDEVWSLFSFKENDLD